MSLSISVYSCFPSTLFWYLCRKAVTCDLLVDLMIFLARAKTKCFLVTLSDLTRPAPVFLILKLYNFFFSGSTYTKQMDTNAKNQDALKCHHRFSAWNPLLLVVLELLTESNSMLTDQWCIEKATKTFVANMHFVTKVIWINIKHENPASQKLVCYERLNLKV